MSVDEAGYVEPFDDVLPAADPAAPRDHGPHRLVAGWITWAGETLALLDVPRILTVLRATLGGEEPARRAKA